MRRWIALLLLVLLPAQPLWAAVSAYCQHAGGSERQHLGHHAHEHQVASGVNAPGQPGTGWDADCADCHTGCLNVLAATASVLGATPGGQLCELATIIPASLPPARPERPQWPVPA